MKHGVLVLGKVENFSLIVWFMRNKGTRYEDDQYHSRTLQFGGTELDMSGYSLRWLSLTGSTSSLVHLETDQQICSKLCSTALKSHSWRDIFLFGSSVISVTLNCPSPARALPNAFIYFVSVLRTSWSQKLLLVSYSLKPFVLHLLVRVDVSQYILVCPYTLESRSPCPAPSRFQRGRIKWCRR